MMQDLTGLMKLQHHIVSYLHILGSKRIQQPILHQQIKHKFYVKDDQ